MPGGTNPEEKFLCSSTASSACEREGGSDAHREHNHPTERFMTSAFLRAYGDLHRGLRFSCIGGEFGAFGILIDH